MPLRIRYFGTREDRYMHKKRLPETVLTFEKFRGYSHFRKEKGIL